MPQQVKDQVEVTGHFGEWLQGRMGPDGPVALVTLHCAALAVRAPGRRLALSDLFGAAALRLFREALGVLELPDLDCAIPLGGGAGASTACLVAAARAAGFDGTPEALAAACLATEGASDPLMYDRPDRMLWASREARALQVLPTPPSCEVVGGFWGAPHRTDPGDLDFPDISDLVEDWVRATELGDLPLAAGVASLSALRCTALKGPQDPMAMLARDLGAVGHVRAHTGSARGLIFAPGTAPRGVEIALSEAGLTGVLRFATGGAP